MFNLNIKVTPLAFVISCQIVAASVESIDSKACECYLPDPSSGLCSIGHIQLSGMSALYTDASESMSLPHFWRCIQYSAGNRTKARGRTEPLGRKKRHDLLRFAI